jgi:radical SAM/Cys-rich protein
MNYKVSLMDLAKDLKTSGMVVEHFQQTLSRHNLRLERGMTRTLQINVGSLCDLACKHCHLAAGPGSREIMDLKTVEHVISYAARCRFESIDLTGGSPELNPHLPSLIEGLASLAPRVTLRSNLSAVKDNPEGRELQELLSLHKVVIYASLPSLNEAQTDSQRGKGYFAAGIKAIKNLNSIGYGSDHSDLELNLVSNPTGAFLSPSQAQTEKRFRHVLETGYGIHFNNLFTISNVPLGRFREWLTNSGNLEKYMDRLISSFNPCTIEGLMCRTLISVSWDGYLFDCDFNLAKRMFLGGRKIHISEMQGLPDPGNPIAVGDHCYACAAGTGFT